MSKIGSERNIYSPNERRQAWMSELAQADPAKLLALWNEASFSPDYKCLRGPEIGAVMTRGRAGGEGGAFNLGEATATRCTVRLASGEEGHCYTLGRVKRKAEIAALCDALMQTDAAATIRDNILAPLAAERAARKREAGRKAAATKVDFFTMTRGEDP